MLCAIRILKSIFIYQELLFSDSAQAIINCNSEINYIIIEHIFYNYIIEHIFYSEADLQQNCKYVKLQELVV